MMTTSVAPAPTPLATKTEASSIVCRQPQERGECAFAARPATPNAPARLVPLESFRQMKDSLESLARRARRAKLGSSWKSRAHQHQMRFAWIVLPEGIGPLRCLRQRAQAAKSAVQARWLPLRVQNKPIQSAPTAQMVNSKTTAVLMFSTSADPAVLHAEQALE